MNDLYQKTLCEQENYAVDLNVHMRKGVLAISERDRSKLQNNAFSGIPSVLFERIDWNCSRCLWKWRYILGIRNYLQWFYLGGGFGGKVFGDFLGHALYLSVLFKLLP